jgi:predicted permease
MPFRPNPVAAIFKFMETLLRDIRRALRRLRRAPAFTTTTVLTLALGIGATTSIFTLVHAVILKSLPVANPEELYRLGRESRCCYQGGYSQDKEFSLVSYDLYKHLRDNTTGFAELAAFPAFAPLFGVRRAGSSMPAQSYPGEFVTGNYFAMFGIRAYAGRALTVSDDRPGAAPVAVMSYRLWQQAYGLDPSVIGSVFNIDEKPFTVVGVTPPGFFGDTLRTSPPDFYLPLNQEPLVEADSNLNDSDTHWLDLLGRVKTGTAPASVEAQMRVELKQWLRSHWGQMNANDQAAFPSQTLFLAPGGAGITSMRQAYEHWLQILMIVTGFVLLIVCANVANLMLVRGIAQRRQTSLSMALGARPSTLVRQALTESVLLALFGGAAGLTIAFAGTRLILHFAFPVGAALPISASPSMPVLLFALGVSVVTGIAFGMGPAWMATKVDPIEALRGASRSTSRTASLPRKSLVVVQAALSLVLLSASGLLTTALDRLEHQDLGIDQDHRMLARIEPRLAGYRKEQLTPLYRRIHDSLVGIPGVSAVALCAYSPQNGFNWSSGVFVDGHPAPGPRDDNSAFWLRVTGGYFEVAGNPVLEGRGIEERDVESATHVAVINEAFARKFFKHEDPIGKYFGRSGMGQTREYQIVGVAKDIRNLTYSLDRPADPFYFLPEAQHSIAALFPEKLVSSMTDTDVNPGSHFMHDITIVTRPRAKVSIAQVRQAMASVDPNLPVISLQSVREQVAGQFSQQRLIARLTSFFGILSLVLASIGLYGVTAYNAAQRVNEMGVRMALGATSIDVLSLVLQGALGLVLVGLLVGLPLTLAVGRVLGTQLYGTNPFNPAVTSVAVLTLGLSALAAALIPAFRASLISPLEALREE